MGARQKLNKTFFNGSLLVASVIGIVAESWLAFGLTLLVLLILSVHSGDIRSSKNR